MNSVEAVKGFKTFALLVLLLGGVTFAGSRFYPSTTGENTISISEISLDEKIEVTDTTATVIWTTKNQSTGYVEYGVNASLCSVNKTDCAIVKSDIPATVHTVRLANLSPETLYFYKIVINGDLGQSVIEQFTTLKAKEYIEEKIVETQGETLLKEEAPVQIDFEGFFGAINTYNKEFDLNGDNIVNSVDYSLFLGIKDTER